MRKRLVLNVEGGFHIFNNYYLSKCDNIQFRIGTLLRLVVYSVRAETGMSLESLLKIRVNNVVQYFQGY